MKRMKKVAVTIGHDLLGNPIVTYRRPTNRPIVHLPKHIQTPELLQTTHPTKPFTSTQFINANTGAEVIDYGSEKNAIATATVYGRNQSNDSRTGEPNQSRAEIDSIVPSIINGTKWYACNQCDKRFSHAPNLRDHIMAVHSGGKPFVCEHCHRTFSRKQNLEMHCLRFHEGSFPSIKFIPFTENLPLG